MSPLSRSKLREKIMIILYQVFIYSNIKVDYDVNNIIKDVLDDELENEFSKNIIYGVIDKKNELDENANKYLKDWSISRLGKTDQAILRMAIYELLYMDTPKVVCIDEAIELSKKYSDDAVRKMINSVLDKIYHNL